MPSSPANPDPAAEDARFMALALEQARLAYALDEVPIGALLVVEGRPIAAEHNRTRHLVDPTAHAEVLTLRSAARRLGVARLVGAALYTTVEPCFMCAGALLHARVGTVVWAVRDPKFGACASQGQLLEHPGLNHRALWREGPGADEARELLQRFFRSKRRGAGGQKPGADPRELP
jgi:tRNA(adenine34) deaminase